MQEPESFETLSLDEGESNQQESSAPERTHVIDTYEALAHAIAHTTRADPSEELLWLRQYKNGDAKAGKSLVMANLKFIFGLTGGRGLPRPELVGEAVIKFLSLAKSYNSKHGVSLQNYARKPIKDHLNSVVSKSHCLLKMPARQLTMIHKLKKAVSEYRKVHGTTPAVSDLALLLNQSEARILQLLRDAHVTNVMSLSPQSKNEDASDSEQLEVLVADSAQAYNSEDNEDLAVAHSALKVLTGRLLEIFCRRHGLMDYPKQTLREISIDMKISCERVRQLENAARKIVAEHRRSLEC